MTEIKPGFWTFDVDGKMRPHAPADPDVVISRRIADFPDGTPPAAALIVACSECGALVANDGRYREKPKICLQCAGIEPLPIGAASKVLDPR